MHVAFWSPAWPLARSQNGIITYVHWMKIELEKLGHKVSIFTGDVPAAHRERGVYRVQRPYWHRLAARFHWRRTPDPDGIFGFATVIAKHISRVHRAEPIDVLEMEESFGWFADITRLTGIPLAVKLHGPAFLSLVDDELTTPFAAAKIAREGDALRKVKTVVSPSALTLSQTIEHYGLSRLATRHIVNPLTMGPDTPLWNLVTCDRNTVLFVGRFDLRKGADVVLKAFVFLLKERPTLRLIFVGPDRGIRAENGALLRFDEFAARHLPAGSLARIDFRGPLANEDVARLRTQAMVTIIASRWENQGYTLLEAMYQGCPVVSTDAGGCPESVVHGVSGRLAKSANPEDFAKQLAAILDDPEGARRMGAAARRHVIEQHSAAKVAAESVSLYESLHASGAR